MKTFSHLWLDDKGIAAFNAPEKPNYFEYEKFGVEEVEINYRKALQQALAERVYFKPEQVDEVIHSLYEDEQLTCGDEMEKLKPYPVPDGYEVKVKRGEVVNCAGDFFDCHCTDTYKDLRCIFHEYAILVTKEKTKDEIDREFIDMVFPVKQQSIEEAAEAYANTMAEAFRNEAKTDFIEGANHLIDELERWAKSYSPITPSALLNKLEQLKQQKS